ncbi:MAG TPA: peptidase T [Patescibacteria group bacterium]|nr:peptidase T [Patescibacteria group bacterium]
MEQQIIERFMNYVRFDTRSDSEQAACPSTPGQRIFARHLVREMGDLGLCDVQMDTNGYVTATLPANIDIPVAAIGFIAHMDTSPDMSGTGVTPQVVTNYDGGDIILNAAKEPAVVLSPQDFPELVNYRGGTLITTDGTTLLGADNKAGICEIITAVEYLLAHPEIQHGPVRIGFTPDEEIGRGADLFDVAGFDTAFAYTVDGGELGELEYENFNAAEARIRICGRNVHPGSAKNKMINALLLAMELHSMLPAAEAPAHTEDHEGFYHLNKLSGNVEEAQLIYIIRDHDRKIFLARKERMGKIVAYMNDRYGDNTVNLSLRDQYFNMKEQIEPVFHIVELAKKAMLAAGVEPQITPVRGGTDGARLSYMGLPCPNIFTGGHNYHGKYEYIPVRSMKKAVEVIIKIIELHARG